MASITAPHERLRVVHMEAALNQISVLGIAFILGFACASAYDRVPELWQKKAQLERVEKVEIPKLKQQVVIEHKKAVVEHDKADRAQQVLTQVLQTSVPQPGQPPPE